MADDLKASVANAAVAVTGTSSVAGLGSPLNVALRYQFVGFAFIMLVLTNVLRQYAKNAAWKASSSDLNAILVKLLGFVFAFGFYLPSAYSLGREAWSLSDSLQVLKPIVYYNVVAALAFKLLEPLQRCQIGAYDGKFVTDPALCRDPNSGDGRSGPWTKFTDMLIAPVLQIISSTVLIPISTSGGAIRAVKRDEKKDIVERYTPSTNINFLETLVNLVTDGNVILAVVLGLLFGLFHRAWLTPKDVVGSAAGSL